jgi:hypothetical protein
LQWLRYTFGGRLPEPLHDWVRHDLTDADWRLRALLRTCVQFAIPIAALMLLPGPVSIRAMTAALVACGALFMGAAYGDVLRDRRMRQHGMRAPDSWDDEWESRS